VRNHNCQQDRGYQWERGGSETTFSKCVTHVATRGHYTVPVQFPLRGGRFEGRMHDGTVTTESLHDRMGSVCRTPVRWHSELGTGVQLSRFVRSIAIAASSVMDIP
jgi:hypothetical protein